MIPNIQNDVIALLQLLIQTPSLSREEEGVAAVLRKFFADKNIKYHTHNHNTWVYNLYYDTSKPTLLLNSHIDTVKPNSAYTRNPYAADIEGGKLYGLGSNDAGGALVTLLGAFLFFYDKENLSFNLCYAATAEEEISGSMGLESIADICSQCACAIVGEPTGMQMAIAEKGLLVVDAYVQGIPGHAARDEGINAIYKAMEDILWLKNYDFEQMSPLLGKVKATVTIIQAGKQHNVVPDNCSFTIDIRTIPEYSFEEILEIIDNHTHASLIPRSMRLKPSAISLHHPLVVAGHDIGIKTFGSATLSDQALLKIPSIKIGPGLSERSHTADEYIYISEIHEALHLYIDLINNLRL